MNTKMMGLALAAALQMNSHSTMALAATQGGLAVESGAALFRSATNVAGIEVSGTSKAVSARAEMEVASAGLSIRNIEATLPVGSLSTGMNIRDEHMRKYIFTTPSGDQPDLHFASEGTTCMPGAQASQFACKLTGTLSFRGVTRPFTLNLKAREQGAAAFRVTGEGTVKLDEFGVTPPEQFGVKVRNEVEIRLDFVSRKSGSPTTERASK